MVYNYIRMGEYYYFFYFFAPPRRVQLQLQLSWNARRRWSPKGLNFLQPCYLLPIPNIRSQKNFFKKYLQTTCFYGIIMLEVEKGVLYMKRLGALSFHYIIYIAKKFLENFLKRVAIFFLFWYNYIVNERKWKNASRGKI